MEGLDRQADGLWAMDRSILVPERIVLVIELLPGWMSLEIPCERSGS